MNNELSKTEWLIMKLCWKNGKSTARQIFESAPESRNWEYQTVKTLLDRIADKGYLKREKLGPLCLYEPSVPRKKAMAEAIDTFFSTVMDNGLAPLFAHLANGRKLTQEELNSLKELVEQHEEDEP
ncbi:MAG: BlaI/MecI/CopY family transcriptional regulator [Kiritimatiellaceae bacterium]|nr:BlaI/MecI/CopY family transcriptional regulator [Kiritimatiellaceae bacterium]